MSKYRYGYKAVQVHEDGAFISAFIRVSGICKTYEIGKYTVRENPELRGPLGIFTSKKAALKWKGAYFNSKIFRCVYKKSDDIGFWWRHHNTCQLNIEGQATLGNIPKHTGFADKVKLLKEIIE